MVLLQMKMMNKSSRVATKPMEQNVMIRFSLLDIRAVAKVMSKVVVVVVMRTDSMYAWRTSHGLLVDEFSQQLLEACRNRVGRGGSLCISWAPPSLEALVKRLTGRASPISRGSSPRDAVPPLPSWPKAP